MSETTVLNPDGTVDEAATKRQRRISELSDRFARENPPPWDNGDEPPANEQERIECDAWHDARWAYIDSQMEQGR